jgi:class 3 adenylate cyclase
VFAGEIGPHYRRTYTVMGDAVNLAARVMARAEPGTVLATPEVLGNARTAFETRPLEPFSVKGKARPVTAFEVGRVALARRDGTRATGGSRLPIVGRDA